MKRLAFLVSLILFLPWNASRADWLDRRFGVPGADGGVHSLIEFRDELYAFGDFQNIAGVRANAAAKWNGTNWIAVTPPSHPIINAVVKIENALAFKLTERDQQYPTLKAWDGAAAEWTVIGLPDGYPYLGVIASDGRNLFAEVYRPVFKQNEGWINERVLAKWSGSWSIIASVDEVGWGLLSAIVPTEKVLYVVGQGSYSATPLHMTVARLSGANWIEPAGEQLHFNSVAEAGMDGANLFVLGYPGSTLPADASPEFATYDGTNWTVMPAQSRDGFFMRNLQRQGDSLLAHEFMTADGKLGAMSNIVDGRIVEYRGTNRTVIAAADAEVWRIERYKNETYVAGAFHGIEGVHADWLARWNGTNWSPVGDGIFQGFDNEATCLATAGTNVFAAGPFRFAGDVEANRIARWDRAKWRGLDHGIQGVVRQMAGRGDDLFVVGNFVVAGATNLAKWNGSWSAVGGFLEGEMMAVCTNGQGVFVARALTATNFVISRWDGKSWIDVAAGESGLYLSIDAMIANGDAITVAGRFQTINGTEMNNIATWADGEWKPLGTGVKLEVEWVPNEWSWSEIYALAQFGTNLVAGGMFLDAGGKPAHHVAMWDGREWTPLGEVPTEIGCLFGVCSYGVRSLLVLDGTLYAGGSGFVWAWDGEKWTSIIDATPKRIADDSQYGPTLHVWAMAQYGKDIFLGGNFAKIGETESYGVALWHTENALQLDSAVDSLSLSWPTQLGDSRLESAESIDGPWLQFNAQMTSSAEPSRSATTIPRPNSTKFFRLNFAN